MQPILLFCALLYVPKLPIFKLKQTHMKKQFILLLFSFYSLISLAQSPPVYVPTTSLEAWYSFTGNTNDLSGHGHTLVNHGAVLTTDRCGNTNSAYYFDGNTSFLSSVDSFFNNGWPNYSISLWFNTDTNSNPFNGNQSQTMFNTYPHYGSEISMSWGGVTDKVDYFYNTSPNNGTWDVFSNNAALSNSTIPTHTWKHVAMVKSDSTYKMYINGVLDNTFTNSAVAINYLCNIYIGTISPPFQPETFWGSLDDYGIWSRSLTDAEVWQLYNNNCNSAVPTCIPITGLIAWYPFSGNTIDETGNGHNLINSNGATLTTDRCGNANSAYSFDGNTTFLSSVDTFFDNGWTNYSITLWFKTDTNSNPYNGNHSQTMFNTSPHYGSEISMSWGGATDKVDYFFNTSPNNGTWDVFSNNAALSNSTIPTHTWKHVALVKSDTTYQLYINGVLDNTFHSQSTAISYLCQIYIGTISPPFNPETFWGSLDDYGIWNRSLSSSEVWQVYNACCTPSGINEIANTNDISLYPNPANDKITLKTGSDMIGAEYTISDLAGRTIMTGKLATENTSISIANLAPSVYLIQIASITKQTLKFVKN